MSKIAIAGASGLVGTALTAYLKQKGHQVYRLVRSTSSADNEIEWNPAKQLLAADQLEGFDAFINLAGDPIAQGRWTSDKKKRILDSRVQATILLVNTIRSLKNKPKVLINASAVGFYGDTHQEWVTETASKGTDFLSDVCQAWEDAADEASHENVRVVKLRLGMVLSGQGGALKQMLLPFKCGLGGVIGSGEQYMSWIALEDVVAVIEEAISNVHYTGPINVVTDEPVTNREFTRTLGAVLRRPTILPMPAWVARLVFGEVADALLLSSSRIKPEKLETLRFRYKYPNLKTALERELSNSL